jgi:fatty-acyl-CoA synthase
MDGESIWNLLDSEKVTFAAGVPTVWMMLLQYMEQHGKDLKHMQRTLIGGSAVPQAMVRKFMQTYNVDVVHAWGMTELSPLGTVCSRTAEMESWVC